MASIALTGILRNSLGEIDVGAVVTFTHLTTTGETIATTRTDLIIPPNGAYSINIEYGMVRVDYTTEYTERYVAIVIVNSDTVATSIPELLSAAVPVAKPVIIQMQGLVADAQAAAATSEAFADQLTTLDLIANAATFAANTVITTKGYTSSGDGGNGAWKQNGVTGQTASQSPAQLGDALLNDANGVQWELVFDGSINVLSLGADKTGAASSTLAIIAAGNGAASAGSTTDSPALVYRDGVVYFPFGKYLIAQGEQIVIPLGVSWIGDAPNINYNIAGLNNTSFGPTIWVENTTVFPVIDIEGKQLRGSAAAIVNMKFSQGQTLRQAGPYAGALFGGTGLFMFSFIGCTFFELGYNTIIKPVDSNGVRVTSCNFIKIGNANNQQAMPPATGYTYGDAIDFTTCYDAFISDTFIESCGGTGAIISTNTKVENCFIDLCETGIKSTADRNQIVGSSIKWHQSDGIRCTNSDGIVNSSNVIMGNNYKSAVLDATIGYAIHFDNTASNYFIVSSNNIVDDYESIAGHNPYKTVRQASIKLGTASKTGVISSNVFSDEDAAWPTAVKNANPITDSSGVINAGNVVLSSNIIQSGGAANLRHSPFTTAAGTTLGSVTKRIAYRDKNGAVVGQIPIYNTIT